MISRAAAGVTHTASRKAVVEWMVVVLYSTILYNIRFPFFVEAHKLLVAVDVAFGATRVKSGFYIIFPGEFCSTHPVLLS